MHRKFIALVLSAALAVTGMTTTSAQAGDDTAEWIAGVAALAIIGYAIADSKKRNRQTYSQTPSYGYGHSGNHDHSWSNGQGHAGNHTVYTPKPRRGHKALPKQCLKTEYLHGRKFRGFSRHCLKRNHVNVKAMPHSCAVKIRDHHTGHRRVVFGGRCLKQHGYSIARAY